MSTIGSKISELLTQNNMTQRELAKRINVTEVTIGRYIKDEREPKGNVIKDIASVFGVTTDYLLGNSNDPKGTLVEKEEYIPQTIAAHFDGDEYTEDDLKDIEEFLEFVKMRNEKRNKDK